MPAKKGQKTGETPLWLRLKNTRLKPEELLKDLGLYESPIRIVDVAEKLGAECFFVDDVEWSGAIEASTKTGEANIYVHRKHPKTRQRFTIAHEIGHLILHTDEEDIQGEWTFANRDHNLIGQSDEEQQANGYAAKLLMPRPMVRSVVAKFGPDVDLLSKEFEVSRAAMRNQLDNLNLL
jgi:hypothetical protein